MHHLGILAQDGAFPSKFDALPPILSFYPIVSNLGSKASNSHLETLRYPGGQYQNPWLPSLLGIALSLYFQQLRLKLMGRWSDFAC